MLIIFSFNLISLSKKCQKIVKKKKSPTVQFDIFRCLYLFKTKNPKLVQFTVMEVEENQRVFALKSLKNYLNA